MQAKSFSLIAISVMLGVMFLLLLVDVKVPALLIWIAAGSLLFILIVDVILPKITSRRR